MDSIKISVSENGKYSSISVVRIDGVIDTLTATHLEEVLDKLLKRGRYELVLDLAGVDYISSAGWGIFISRIKEIRQNKGDIKLANMVPNVLEIYELLEFDNILNYFDTVSGAKSAFGGVGQPEVIKKKVMAGTAHTTIEELPFKTEPSREQKPVERRIRKPVREDTTSVERLIEEAIGRDPFYSISELKMVLSEKMLGSAPGWWSIFRMLWRKNLVSRRSRFRFARQQRYH